VHYRTIADDILARSGGRSSTVLDFGCGEALQSERIAERVGHLFLCDGADRVRTGLVSRFAHVANITVLGPAELAARLPAGSLDVVVVNSVVQYLTRDEFSRLLSTVRPLMRSTGRLIVADVLPPEQSAARDALALLNFAARHGFLFSAVGGLVRAALSPYVLKRGRFGLTRYAENDLLSLMRQAGYAAARQHPNMGHNQRRMLFEARPSGAQP
jgi:SAM-dependent methyltransferase